MSVEQPKKMLSNLAKWLEAGRAFAEERKYEPDKLLSYKLTADQYTLVQQIQAACDTAKLTAARLTAKDAPSYPDEEATVQEILDRIRATIAFLDTLTAADFDGAEDRLIPLRFAPGKGARGAEYFQSFGQPNFYFHTTMAYALLRQAGAQIGKRAYIGSLRMEDMPG